MDLDLQVMVPAHSSVVHMGDPHKAFLLMDLDLGFYKARAANLSFNLQEEN